MAPVLRFPTSDAVGRSLVHCVSGIQDLASMGIRFIATSQGLDTDESNPASKLPMHILAAVAQFERVLIREHVAAVPTLCMRPIRAWRTPTLTVTHSK
jgi:DNA invertase Pin-like site-specific DNA recombinase